MTKALLMPLSLFTQGNRMDRTTVSCHPGKGHLQMWLEIECGYEEVFSLSLSVPHTRLCELPHPPGPLAHVYGRTDTLSLACSPPA